jgi:hypothetical protein
MNVIQDEWKKDKEGGSSNVSNEAWLLVNNLYNMYTGETAIRLTKITDYLDESLFMAKPKVTNMFNGSCIPNYAILDYARHTVLPRLCAAALRKIHQEEDPLRNRNWN